MKILGIDEAGRGPVIGPMVIVGFEIDEAKIDKLKELGVKDSKELTREERERIFEDIIKLADRLYIEIVSNEEINKWMKSGLSLNLLELKKMVKIITESDSEVVYLDCPSSNPDKFRTELMKYLKKEIKIVAENRADKKYPVVSAASIVAKVIRDREIDKIKEEVGVDFGSGYPSDPLTQKALREDYDKLRKYIRTEWQTAKKFSQRLLLDYL